MKISRLLTFAAVGFVVSLFLKKNGRQIKKEVSLMHTMATRNRKKNNLPALGSVKE